MNKKYLVKLTDEERHSLQLLVSKGRVAARTITRAWVLLKAGHAAYEGHLVLVTLLTLAVAIPLEVGKGAGTGRFPSIARSLAPFAAWAMLLALVLSAVRLAKVVGL